MLMQIYEYLLKDPFYKEGLDKLSTADFDIFTTRTGEKHFIKEIVFIQPRMPLYAYGLIYLPKMKYEKVLWTNQGRCFGENNVHYERFDLLPPVPSIN